MALIELNNVCFGYRGETSVLTDVDLAINAYDRLCITGHNGAGKSTLLKLMVGLLKPAAGTVTAFGEKRVTEKDFNAVRRRIGFVFQDADDQLFCPTVAEDIAFGPMNLGYSQSDTIQMVDDILKQLDLYHLKDRITHKLSGGEKRLVSLAGVLVMKPDILLLDEPTNALDEENERKFTDILLSLNQAMVIVSHDPHFRRKIGNRFLSLKNGQLVDPTSGCKHAVS